MKIVVPHSAVVDGFSLDDFRLVRLRFSASGDHC